jgi:ribosomal protein S18 acetylase RimI-like enzyme
MIVRPPKPADYAAILEVVGASAQHDWTHRADPRAIFKQASEGTSSVVVISHRQLVGYATWELEAAAGGLSLNFQGWVAPLARRTEVGTALFIAVENAATEAGAFEVRAANYDTVGGFAELAAARQFVEERRFNQMWLDFPAKFPPTPPMADGFHMEPYADHWHRALVEAENESFASHWGASPGRNSDDILRGRIQQIAAMPQAFDPDLFLLACSDQEVAAFALGQPSPLEGPAGDAWIWHVGTRPQYRKRRLARSLLVALLDRLARNYSRVGLHVDTLNLPAVTLYESLGFRTRRQRIHIRKEISAKSDHENG